MTVQIKKETTRKLIDDDHLFFINNLAELLNPYRMIIMQALVRHGNVEFRQMKYSIPRITDGNLASNLKVLEQAGYVQVQKEIVDRKVRTSYEITEKGQKAFSQLKDALISFYKEEDNCDT